MDVVLTVVGIVCIAIGLMDIFHTLLHPTGRGRVGHWVLSIAWRFSKATGHRLGSALGPAAMIAVVLVWVALQAIGWALIYLPHIPDGFLYSSGVDPTDYPRVAEALYISVVTLSTLGFGDVVALDPWLRLASPFEALTGFALLTAAFAWFMQISPPLSRRRVLALHLKSLAGARYAEELGEIEPVILTRVVDMVTVEVGQVSVDLEQYSESFYFQERNPDLSLARQLPYALRIRDACLGRRETAVRKSGQRLSLALEQLGAVLRRSFLRMDGTLAEVFTAYASEHGQTRVDRTLDR